MAGQVKPAATLDEALAAWRGFERAVLAEVVGELEAAGVTLDADQLRWAVARVRERLQASVETRGGR